MHYARSRDLHCFPNSPFLGKQKKREKPSRKKTKKMEGGVFDLKEKEGKTRKGVLRRRKKKREKKEKKRKKAMCRGA